MDVQFGPSGLEVDIAERLKAADFQLREFYKDAAISCEAFEVEVALPIEVGTHFLDLKIGHIANAPAEAAFVRARAAKSEPFNQSSLREHLSGGAYDLAEAETLGVDADNVRAAGDPDISFVFTGF